MLLKIGCEPSDGSDSQPSVCNINFDKINKMVVNMQSRPATDSSNIKKKIVVRPQSYYKPNARNVQPNYNFSSDKSRDIGQKRDISPTVPLRGSTAISQRKDR